MEFSCESQEAVYVFTTMKDVTMHKPAKYTLPVHRQAMNLLVLLPNAPYCQKPAIYCHHPVHREAAKDLWQLNWQDINVCGILAGHTNVLYISTVKFMKLVNKSSIYRTICVHGTRSSFHNPSKDCMISHCIHLCTNFLGRHCINTYYFGKKEIIHVLILFLIDSPTVTIEH